LLGQKQYELVSHLGNVHATILDRRGKKRSDGAYLPAVAALYDYFPFGMLMPDRWSQDTSSKTAFAQATVPVPVAQHTPVQQSAIKAGEISGRRLTVAFRLRQVASR